MSLAVFTKRFADRFEGTSPVTGSRPSNIRPNCSLVGALPSSDIFRAIPPHH